MKIKYLSLCLALGLSAIISLPNIVSAETTASRDEKTRTDEPNKVDSNSEESSKNLDSKANTSSDSSEKSNDKKIEVKSENKSGFTDASPVAEKQTNGLPSSSIPFLEILSSPKKRNESTQKSYASNIISVGIGAAALFGISHLVHGISNIALIPPIETNCARQENSEFYEIKEDGYRVLGWHSQREEENAVLFLPGNAYSFGGAIDFSRYILGKVTNDGHSARVYTVAYIGQDSSAPGFYRNEEAQVTAVKKAINKIKADGYSNSRITILAHSIGGFLSGLALQDDAYDGIAVLSVASPASLGKVASQMFNLSTGTAPFFNLAGWWFGDAIEGYTKDQAGPRISLYAEHDTIVPYPASIAAGLSNENRGILKRLDHNNCFNLDHSFYFDGSSSPDTIKEILYLFINR